jgi:GNAT superfamily N-acetyltransferase
MMRIAPLTAADHADWLPLWRGYLDFYETALPPETFALTFARLTDPANGEMGGFIARGEDGAALGLVHWIDHRSCWTPGDYCYLQDLFVASSARGRGVGAELIEAVTEAARGRGCSRVYWLTHESNATARSLYDKLATRSGFIQYVRKLS